MPDDPTSDEFKRRNKHLGGDKFTLAPILLTQLPQLNKGGLSVARDFVRGKTKSLPFTFFEKAFPTEAQDIILEVVRSHVVSVFVLCVILYVLRVFRIIHKPTHL